MAAEITYRERRAYGLRNEHLEIVVSVEGGHIAAVLDLASGINPLWSPPWPSIEPSTYDPRSDTVYGANAESKLLSGILGHNLCLDLFGGPSPEEAAAGIPVHGEGSIAPYEITVEGDTLTQSVILATCQLRFTRTIELPAGSRTAVVKETVENLAPCDRPIAWTQHVTLGPPFLEKGVTIFRANATRSKVMEADFAGKYGYLKLGAEFEWPFAPGINGESIDLQVYTNQEASGAYTAHLMNPRDEEAYFRAESPTHGLALTYTWKRADFPWLGIWEENYSRSAPPWNGKSLTRGMEFGVSPFPESRRAMIERGPTFGTPGYRWVPAKSKVSAAYSITLAPAE